MALVDTIVIRQILERWHSELCRATVSVDLGVLLSAWRMFQKLNQK